MPALRQSTHPPRPEIVSTAGPDNGPQWSPDGRQIVFSGK
jgi:Tol biopolymer transport system component